MAVQEMRAQTTGVILAGGRGRRMGGRDKGLVPLLGRPMITHPLARLRSQVSVILVSANRNAEIYMRLGRCPVVQDVIGEYAGPLAGVASAMAAARTKYLVTVPCDAPLLAPDLVSRLYHGMQATGAKISVARDAQRVQPMFALLHCDLLPRLLVWLRAGGRQARLWYEQQGVTLVPFSDRAEMFYNLNRPLDGERFNPGSKHRVGED
ncbi:MAG: molybdenum cofactor guanylyltransferase MobA [Gammaproteobacteria bacterium]